MPGRLHAGQLVRRLRLLLLLWLLLMLRILVLGFTQLAVRMRFRTHASC